MRKLLSLPNEILQNIASYLSLREKYRFLRTSKESSRAFYNNNLEYNEIWGRIFKDTSWLELMNSRGFIPALIGVDIPELPEIDDGILRYGERLTVLLTCVPREKEPASQLRQRIIDRRAGRPWPRIVMDKELLLRTLKPNEGPKVWSSYDELDFPGFRLLMNIETLGRFHHIAELLHKTDNITSVIYFGLDNNQESTPVFTIPVKMIKDLEEWQQFGFSIKDETRDKFFGRFTEDS